MKHAPIKRCFSKIPPPAMKSPKFRAFHVQTSIPFCRSWKRVARLYALPVTIPRVTFPFRSKSSSNELAVTSKKPLHRLADATSGFPTCAGKLHLEYRGLLEFTGASAHLDSQYGERTPHRPVARGGA